MLKKTAVSVITATAAAMLLTASPAHASGDVATSGQGGVLSGNQVVAGVSVPANVCGNAIAILGNAGASCFKPSAAARG